MSRSPIIKVGINGFGRIGRLVLRAARNFPNIQVVAINDPFIPADYMKYMFYYDSVHGRYNGTVVSDEGKLIVDGKSINVSNELDPTKIHWGAAGADYVVEATGKFLTEPGAAKHLVGGAKTLLMADKNAYTEYSVGLDNIGFGKWRFLRVDYVISKGGINQKQKGFVFSLSLF